MKREGEMRAYLFDASAAVEFYHPRADKIKKTLSYLSNLKTIRRQATLFIPNFFIAEVFNTFAKKLRTAEIDTEMYVAYLDQFRMDIHWGRRLYPYDLNRYHVIAADRIIPVEHRLASRDDRD